MNSTNVLPLAASLLNLTLAGVTLARNSGSPVHRMYACLAGTLTAWSFGVLMVRQAQDEASVAAWDSVVHAAVLLVPAVCFHFVLVFLGTTRRHRVSLALAYGASVALGILLLVTGSPGSVKTTPIDWAFLVYVVVVFAAGVVLLIGASGGAVSSFRRNRGRLIALGTLAGLVGILSDFAPTAVGGFWPSARRLYPVGVPAAMVFGVVLALSITRQRLFDVIGFVKEAVLYVGLAATMTLAAAGIAWTLAQYYEPDSAKVFWSFVPLTFVLTLLVGPLSRALDRVVQRVVSQHRRTSYQALLDLSRRMRALLDSGPLAETLVDGLVRGVPVTHSVLLTWDAAQTAYVPYRQRVFAGPAIEAPAIRGDHAIAQWLEERSEMLVKDEVPLHATSSQFFADAAVELDRLPAALILALKVERKLTGILLLGEKVSGAVFDAHELEVLGMLANQAAISLENARLYEGLSASNSRLMEASRLKSQFLASMSHELRTPLNSVIGFSKVLLNRLDGDLNERQEAYVRSIHTSSAHLLQLINGVLDFSRSEAGKLEMRVEEVPIHELVDECVETSLPLVRDKPVKIDTDVPIDLPRVRADRTKVKQILLNLLANAAKFTGQGNITVQARVDAGQVRVTVADTGIGIREADLGRLFEPFQRLDSPLSRAAGGTGLGLTISKRFVELHGGKIWAESRESQGSTFHFTLPIG